jgi:hypothetical protein
MSKVVSRQQALTVLHFLYLERYGEIPPKNLSTSFIDQFVDGINIETEHAKTIAKYAPNKDDIIIAGSIALDHLDETSDYYTKLKQAGL